MLSWKSESLNSKAGNMKTIVFILSVLLAAGCNQNIEVADSGERLEDSLKPKREPEVPPFVKAYFMHTWVEALYSTPQNKDPNPDWESPLADPEAGRVLCTDCHVSGEVDFTKIPKMRVPAVEEYEKNQEFMADLMKKWVARLNSTGYKAKAKLKKPVTCVTCHATNAAPDAQPER